VKRAAVVSESSSSYAELETVLQQLASRHIIARREAGASWKTLDEVFAAFA
jgi:hypothetical protein